jgi:hypothetical protein
MLGDLPFSTVLELVVCLFLAATVAYCAVIDRKLRAMRAGQDGMRELIGDLGVATQDAVTAIEGLKRASEQSGEELAESIRQAKVLSDELSVMVEAGRSIADRLSRGDRAPASMSRPAQVSPTASRAASRPASPRDAATAARAASQLLDALKKNSG